MIIENVNTDIQGPGQIVQAPLEVNDNILPIVRVVLSADNIPDLSSKAILTHYTADDINVAAKSAFVKEMPDYEHSIAGDKYFVSLLKVRVTEGLNIKLAYHVPSGSSISKRKINVKMITPINGLTITPVSVDNILLNSTFAIQLSLAAKLGNIDATSFNQDFDRYPLIFTTDKNGEDVEVGRLHLILDNQPHFYIHIEPKDYKGEYGFDYMKKEYIEPIRNVNGTPTAICSTIPQLEAIYNPEFFFENQSSYKQYYSPWIALSNNNKEYKLLLKKTILSGNIPNKTQIEFRCTSANIEINQLKINNIQSPVRVEYKDNQEFQICCVGEISEANLAIELFAILPLNEFPNILPFRVGRMLVYPNNNVRNVELLFVHLLFSNSCNNQLKNKYKSTGNDSLQNIFNYNSLNQLLVSCATHNITLPQIIDLRNTADGMAIINRYLLNEPAKKIYEKDGTYSTTQPATPYRETPEKRATNGIFADNEQAFFSNINEYIRNHATLNASQRTAMGNRNLKIITLINVTVQTSAGITLQDRMTTGSFTTGTAVPFNDSTVIYCEGFNNYNKFNKTIIHELGHLLGIARHPFDMSASPQYLQGYTNYFMDYDDDDATGNAININKTQFSKPEWDNVR